jgi:cytochrome P450
MPNTEHTLPRGACPAGSQAGAVLDDESRSDPLIHNDPFGFYHRLRESRPVFYDSKLKMYLISRYDDVHAVLRDPHTFSLERAYHDQYAGGYLDEFRQIMEREGGGFVRDVIAADPPVHTRLRRLLERAFTAHRMKDLEPRVRQIVSGIIEPLAERGFADGIRDIGVPLTARIICEQLGFDFDEIGVDRIKRWTTAHLAQMGKLQSHDEMLKNAREVCEMQNYIIPRMHERERSPKEDMISDLVHARVDDEQNPTLSFEEKVSCIRALLIAGNDTTAGAMANLMLVLATNPDLARQLHDSVDDERLLSRFVEEVLRIQPPVHGLFRMTTREVELGGTVLPEGAQVMILFASANDDEAKFPCPRSLDVNRNNLSNHLTFGSGIHRCIGAALARMEVRVAASEIIRTLDNIRLAIPVSEITYIPTFASQTVTRLPLTFSRRKTAAEYRP